MEKLSQAQGAFFKQELLEAACFCLFPHLIKMGQVWLFYPGSGRTTKEHSGQSSMPFFLEEPIVSLHVQ